MPGGRSMASRDVPPNGMRNEVSAALSIGQATALAGEPGGLR
jgi:hypothetical protein